MIFTVFVQVRKWGHLSIILVQLKCKLMPGNVFSLQVRRTDSFCNLAHESGSVLGTSLGKSNSANFFIALK